jgi:hypothetical protein
MHTLRQNDITSFFRVKITASENLVNPESKSTPDDEEVAEFD